jgi:hypothetical protein
MKYERFSIKWKPFLFTDFNDELYMKFALGVEAENLFKLFQRKKFGTKNPAAFSAATPKYAFFLES